AEFIRMIAAGAAGEGADLGLGGQCGLAAGAASDLLAPGAGEDRIVPGSGHLDEDRARYASGAGARPPSGAPGRPGAGGGPRPGAGEDRIVPGSGHLDEDRARYASVAGARPQSGAHDRPGTAGDPLPGEGIPVLIGDEDDGCRVAAGGAGGGDIGEPAGLDESLHFGAAVGGDEEEFGVLDRRPQQTDLPRVGVGRMLVEVVAVRIIGADDEAELRHRGEGRRPGADG